MTDRFQRQQTLVPQARLQTLSAGIIGVGALGRQVAVQLASLGIPRLQLIDFDQVEATNITTQGYLQRDLEAPKVSATARALAEIDPTLQVEPLPDRYRPRYPLPPVVFCCVDSIASREAIWRSAQHRTEFWCDGRMLGEVLRIITAADEASKAAYAATLFAPAEAEPGSCTSRGVIYPAAIAAGLMLHQFTRWLREIPVEQDLCLNLLDLSFVGSRGP